MHVGAFVEPVVRSVPFLHIFGSSRTVGRWPFVMCAAMTAFVPLLRHLVVTVITCLDLFRFEYCLAKSEIFFLNYTENSNTSFNTFYLWS